MFIMACHIKKKEGGIKMKNFYIKITLTILPIIWLCSYCVNDMLVINPTDYGIKILSERELSFDLHWGTESVILFDEKTGVRGKITRFEQIDDGEFYVTGQIDFFKYDKARYENFKQVDYYTLVGIAFNVQYRQTENPEQLELIAFDIMELPGNKETLLITQKNSVNLKSMLQINEQIDSSINIFFSNIAKNVTAEFSWDCAFAIIDAENGRFSITIKPMQEDKAV